MCVRGELLGTWKIIYCFSYMSPSVWLLSDTLVKLMEYGEDDDDSEETDEQSPTSNSVAVTAQKPFWAL